jgi:ribosomal protein S18 acetylase RimI-like enzyme
MPSLHVRDATPDDAEALGPLLAALGYPASPAVIGERLATLRASDRTGRTLVAAEGATLLGFATLHRTPTLHRDTAVGRITGIAVLPEAQGRGVGGLLVAAAEAHFQAQGITRVEVTSGPTHVAAYTFYRHRGYEDQGVRFAKRLIPPAPGPSHPDSV